MYISDIKEVLHKMNEEVDQEEFDPQALKKLVKLCSY
jgi:hypothetical protein